MNVRQRFVAKRTSFQHSKHAMKKMSQSIKNFDCKLESEIGKGSTAEQLMELLRQDADVKHTAIFYNDSTSYYVKLSKRVSLVSCSENSELPPVEKEILANELFHASMKKLMNDLRLNGKILLACAWTTKE